MNWCGVQQVSGETREIQDISDIDRFVISRSAVQFRALAPVFKGVMELLHSSFSFVRPMGDRKTNLEVFLGFDKRK